MQSRGVPLFSHSCCINSENIASGVDVEVPKDSENGLQCAQFFDFE